MRIVGNPEFKTMPPDSIIWEHEIIAKVSDDAEHLRDSAGFKVQR